MATRSETRTASPSSESVRSDQSCQPRKQHTEPAPSLTGALAFTVLEEIYRSLDETYAYLGLARWNQPPAEALWQARRLEPSGGPDGVAQRSTQPDPPRSTWAA